NAVRLIEQRFCISPILFNAIAKIILPLQGSMSLKMTFFFGVILTQEGSRNYSRKIIDYQS
uniref:hypothetical protein n=1 Tax=Sphingobacterium mizutaii TaxID=1010 RepID=UPI0028B0B99F